MPAINYRCVHHRNKPCILVQFEANTAWNDRIKKVPGAQWSKTLHGWTIPDTPENRKKCGLAKNDAAIIQSPTPLQTSKAAFDTISDNNTEQLQKFLQQLQLKGYSPSTIRTYRNEFAQLLHVLGEVLVQNLEPSHLQRYLLYCIKNGLKENSVHSRLNALTPLD